MDKQGRTLENQKKQIKILQNRIEHENKGKQKRPGKMGVNTEISQVKEKKRTGAN